ncbi:uncharacterized protein ATNIH1004_004014 [Aspergillus tanneri]|uniref:Uncharacterized protein n=1 Tax=Aspergillus tanneri TaxID=1220188 RepID=A0A5M9MM90_9EURO|nr:uncharacterized protein ATNIH1004_004014 [Aspergillus tanneri]KAA8648131.1 hypothetical protein ATNIH1004_004014 [Aspergillus tanneri]
MADKEDENAWDSRDPLPISYGGSPDFPFLKPYQEQELTSDSCLLSISKPQHPSSEEEPSSSSDTPLQSAPTIRQPTVRPPVCTHSVVERQYCVHEFELCESCGRIPFLGWFFACVEDTSGFSDPLDPIRGPFLSPWILKAIENGNYTVEEREVLIQQKLGVMRMAALEKHPSSPALSLLEVENEPGEYITQYNQSPFRVNQSIGHTQQTSSSTSYTSSRPLPPPPCTLRACRHCERRFANLEERSWSSINEICSDPTITVPAAWELAGRPVSDSNTVRNLGLRQVTMPYPNAQSASCWTTRSHEKVADAKLYIQKSIASHELPHLVNQSLTISGQSASKSNHQAVNAHPNESIQPSPLK